MLTELHPPLLCRNLGHLPPPCLPPPQWEEALGVLDQMALEGIQPVTRTFNTLMIGEEAVAAGTHERPRQGACARVGRLSCESSACTTR